MIHTHAHHHPARRVSAEEVYRPQTSAIPAGAVSDVPNKYCHPQYQPGRAQKRQKRVFAEYHYPQQQQHPRYSSHALHTIPLEEASHPPRIRRIPFDFEPPSREEYWKQRCLRMQNIYYESRYRLKEMKEDQRQLRRRIQELEKQLLLQSSCNAGCATSKNDDDDSVVDSRDNDEDGRKRDEATEPRVRHHSTSTLPDRSSNNRTPPAVLAIPRCMSAAACFYLTDGEGLSDSELLDDEEGEEYMDERDDQAQRG
jgi:hypothetical protein